MRSYKERMEMKAQSKVKNVLTKMGMGINGFNGLQGCALTAQQILLDFYALLAHNIAIVLAQQIVNLGDATGGAVFDG